MTVLIGSSLLAAWSVANAFVVMVQAKATAANAPFCVQVKNGPFDYRPASNLADLFGLSILAPYESGGGSQDYQFTFHAVLVVADGEGAKLYNWSFRSQTFLPISDDALPLIGVEIACQPR